MSGARRVWGCQEGRVTLSAAAPALIYLVLIHRGLGVESKPELQRVLEHRRRNQLFRQKKEEEEAKKLQSPFEKELLKRHQRLDQVEPSCQSSPGYPNHPVRWLGYGSIQGIVLSPLHNTKARVHPSAVLCSCNASSSQSDPPSSCHLHLSLALCLLQVPWGVLCCSLCSSTTEIAASSQSACCL